LPSILQAFGNQTSLAEEARKHLSLIIYIV